MTVYLCPDTDPHINFATEARLHAAGRGDYLMVYINDPCVVIGRNQVAGAEADLDYCRSSGIEVIRRISGGGAVYHDHGNVNYSFIRSSDSPLTDTARDLGLVARILESMGVDCTIGPRKELRMGKNKISGTACFSRRGRYIFHGTLLFDCDLDKLTQVLAGDQSLRGRKTASVPSPVMNISGCFSGDLSCKDFARQFAQTAIHTAGGSLADRI